MTKLRIFLADDHAIVRAGLRALINAESDMEVIGEAGNGAEALQRIEVAPPDVAVLDLSMPELNGAQTTQCLRRDHPQVKVLALTIHEDRGYLRELLGAGASGYVLKRAGAEELVRAIRVVAGAEVFLDSRVARTVIGNFVEQRTNPHVTADLSERETEAMRLIAQGYVTKEVATNLGLSTKTVESIKARAMEKLGLRNRVDIVRAAAQRGWLQGL